MIIIKIKGTDPLPNPPPAPRRVAQVLEGGASVPHPNPPPAGEGGFIPLLALRPLAGVLGEGRVRVFVWAPLVLALALLIIVGIRVVAAQAPTPSDDEVNAVARELYCPVCENIPLDVCPTTACAQWRELIRQMLAQGKSKDQIKQYFVAQYGDRVLAEPPRSGLNWLAYGLPPVIFLVGIYLVYRGLRGARPRSPQAKLAAAPAAPPPGDNADPYLAQVEEELKKRL